MEEEEELHLQHCSHCVFTGDGCKSNGHCPIVRCPLSCGARMHGCKADEHVAEVCGRQKVRCINAIYGCRLWLLREAMGSHLAHCPAAVLQCNMERSRRLLTVNPQRSDAPTADQCQPEHLDLCLALSDQSKLNGVMDGITALEDVDTLSPVAKECILCKRDPGSQHLHVLGSMAACNGPAQALPGRKTPKVPLPFYCKHDLHVDLSLDFLPKHRAKPTNWVTWTCGQLVRRDEYSQHVRNFHADVVNSLDGWMLARCPMYGQGCDLVVTRLAPAGGSLAYSFWSDSIVLRCCDAAAGHQLPTDGGLPGLLDLPMEVLQRICNQLDANSIRALSMTSRLLREVSRRQLDRQGMVEYLWTRRQGSWRPAGLRWTFSQCFAPILQWTVRPAGEILDHLRRCPHLDPVVHSKRMPVLTIAL